MDTSGSLLERLAGAPTDDDWRRLDDLYRPLLRAWMARARRLSAEGASIAEAIRNRPRWRKNWPLFPVGLACTELYVTVWDLPL
jgi:hypothetical protein